MKKIIITIIIITLILITGCNKQKQETENCIERKAELQMLILDAENKINAEGLGCGIKKTQNQNYLTFINRQSEVICRPVFNLYQEYIEEYKELNC